MTSKRQEAPAGGLPHAGQTMADVATDDLTSGDLTPDDLTPDGQDRSALPPAPRLTAEVWIVLGMTLLQSAIYAILKLLDVYLDEQPVSEHVTTMNPSRSSIDYLNLTYQVVGIAFRLVPVALALYLLSAHGRIWWRRLGVTGGWRGLALDLPRGLALAAAIGLPGLGLYAASRALGQGVRIDTSGLPDLWWSAAILLASAAVTGIYEEVIVSGYLLTRLRDLRWGVPAMLIASALLRGGYHLYQGWPMALGNVVMGLAFSFVYLKTGRLGPLILAHWTMDAVAFIGPELAPQSWLDALHAA